MKFYNYLNEDIDELNNLMEDIDNKCSEFRKLDAVLFSGRKNKNKLGFIDIPRKDRMPLNTPIKLHNFIDDLFEKYKGKRLRSNSLFCSFNKELAETYNHPYYIFPVGKNFEIGYNETIEDLYIQLRYIVKHKTQYNSLSRIKRIDDDKFDEMILDIKDDLEKIVKNYKKAGKNIPGLINHEYMLYCKEYITVDYYKVHNNFTMSKKGGNGLHKM